MGALAIDKAKKAGANAEELNRVSSDAFWEATLYSDQIDEILSWRLVRRAQRWGVPVPTVEEGKDWSRSSQLWTWSLTTQGAMNLRREIAAEIEARQKPWLSWASLVISGAGLAVAIVALIFSLQGNSSPPGSP